MVLQPLAPRVEDHQPANGATQALRIRRDLEQGVGGGLKQQVGYHALVDERETRERLRHREDDVDVATAGAPARGPSPRRCAPRSDTSGNAGRGSCCTRGRLRALLTAIAVPAERRGAALRDGPEDAPMCPVTQARCVSRTRSPCRRRCRPPRRVAASPLAAAGACDARCRAAGRPCIASSGLATACRCRCDKCR